MQPLYLHGCGKPTDLSACSLHLPCHTSHVSQGTLSVKGGLRCQSLSSCQGASDAKSEAADMRHAEMGHVAMGIAEDGKADVGHADMGDADMNRATLIWISACKNVPGSPWTCLHASYA